MIKQYIDFELHVCYVDSDDVRNSIHKISFPNFLKKIGLSFLLPRKLFLAMHHNQIMVDLHGRHYGTNLHQPLKVPLTVQLIHWNKLATYPVHKIAPLGNSLYRLVFAQEIEARFQVYLAQIRQQEGVRVCLCTQSNDLSEATWEILCSQLMPVASFLSLDPKTQLN